MASDCAVSEAHVLKFQDLLTGLAATIGDCA